MHLYIAMTFWLAVIVLAAWGVRRLWDGLAKPRVINIALLPGTLIAQLGHVLGLLVTGATVNNTTLYKDENGEPGSTPQPNPRIPVVGTVIIGLLPLVACAAAIAVASRFLGSGIVGAFGNNSVATTLPTSLAGFWQFLRDQVSLVEALVSAIGSVLPGDWRIWLFVYLMICLSVRMAPVAGNVRGSLGAIGLLGLLTTVAGLISNRAAGFVESAWVLLSLCVATLLLLLLVSALIRGIVGLIQVASNRG